jgi:hypothetical protein
LCSRSDGRLPLKAGLVEAPVLLSTGAGRGAEVALALGAVDLRRVLSELLVRWNLRTRPSGPTVSVCMLSIFLSMAAMPLTHRAVGLLRRAGPAGHGEAALHACAGGELRFHRQPSGAGVDGRGADGCQLCLLHTHTVSWGVAWPRSRGRSPSSRLGVKAMGPWAYR